jgi:hypothetical protein
VHAYISPQVNTTLLGENSIQIYADKYLSRHGEFLDEVPANTRSSRWISIILLAPATYKSVHISYVCASTSIVSS